MMEQWNLAADIVLKVMAIACLVAHLIDKLETFGFKLQWRRK